MLNISFQKTRAQEQAFLVLNNLILVELNKLRACFSDSQRQMTGENREPQSGV